MASSAPSLPRRHHRTCNLCEAMCGVVVETDGARITTIRGDRDDPLSAGHICPKALALKDVHEDPERLRQPLRRRADGSFEVVSWEQALSEAAQRIHATQQAYGRHAVGVYLGNPNVHNHGALLFAQLLLRTLRSRSVFSATSVDQLPHMLASYLMLGHQLLFPVPDVDRTGFLLMLGANPLASNGSLLTAPGIERRLKALLARGGRLVVVDPRRTETAALASQHLAIRPGSDAFLLLALLHVITTEGLMRPGRLAEFSNGLADVAALATDMPPERAAGLTGLEASAIRDLARAFAAAPAAVAYGRMGVSTQAFGGLCAWLVNLLNVVTGNFDRVGGALFARPAVGLVDLATRIGQRGSFARRRTRLRGLPEFSGEWPAATLAEEIETPGDGQLRAMITLAGNPVLSTPNGTRLERALPQLDSLIAIDFYLNETTRHAHLILPPTFALERDHYDVVFHLLAVRNTAKYSPALFEPAPDARHDWQILLDLSTRLMALRRQRLRAAAVRALLGRLGPTGLVGLLLRFGPHGQGWRPFGRGLSLRLLRARPHGVDLGALEPCLPARLATPDQRLELLPAPFVDDLARLRTQAREREQAGQVASGPAPLTLIGRRDLRSNNSWLHNSARLVKGPERCTLLMHPDDATARALADGQTVQVRSRVGTVRVPLQVTDVMSRGVVSLPHGWGHDRPGTRLTVASERPGASLNDITDEQQVDVLTGTAAFSGVAVEVEAG